MSKKEVEKQTQRAYDLFDNPMTRSALKNMTPEQIEYYKEIGKSLYNNVDFTKSEVLNNTPQPMTEALEYIKLSLKSGLLPKDLDKDEINLLVECLGKEWYKEFGFSIEDI